MTDIDKLTRETIDNGGILILLYYDLHSPDQEKLKQLATGFVDQIIKTQGVVYALGEIDEPIESNGLFSTTIEVKALVKDMRSLINVCSLYPPISVEILRPNEIKLSIDKTHDILMDISTNWFGIKKFIKERVSTKEELEEYKKYLDNRMEVGKKMLEKKETNKDK